jgi:multimeric flavodoxin WrbA
MKELLIVANTPSPNTLRLAEAVKSAAQAAETEDVNVKLLSPFDTAPEDVLACDAIILGTTENLGYMSGAMKDFFDRNYYPCLDKKQGLPCVLYIRAGHDGTGTKRAVETIVTGLKWRWVQEPIILRGDFQETFVTQCRELGELMALSLDAGII